MHDGCTTLPVSTQNEVRAWAIDGRQASASAAITTVLNIYDAFLQVEHKETSARLGTFASRACAWTDGFRDRKAVRPAGTAPTGGFGAKNIFKKRQVTLDYLELGKYNLPMIKTYRHNGLKELFETGATRRIDAKFHARCREALDVLQAATDLRALNLPQFRLHQLKQFKPLRYSIWISGAWRITFEWDKGDAYRVDFEQYH